MQEATFTLPRGALRRELLTAGAFTALAGIATVAIAKPDPTPAAVEAPTDVADAELVDLADRFMALQEQVDAWNAGRLHLNEETGSALVIAQSDLMDEMDEQVAATMIGHRARARVIKAWYAIDENGDCASELDPGRILVLLDDLLGERA